MHFKSVTFVRFSSCFTLSSVIILSSWSVNNWLIVSNLKKILGFYKVCRVQLNNLVNALVSLMIFFNISSAPQLYFLSCLKMDSIIILITKAHTGIYSAFKVHSTELTSDLGLIFSYKCNTEKWAADVTIGATTASKHFNTSKWFIDTKIVIPTKTSGSQVAELSKKR